MPTTSASDRLEAVCACGGGHPPSHMVRAGGRLLDWLFPRACVLCEAPGSTLCAPCHADTANGVEGACRRCAIPLHAAVAERTCGRCLRRPPAFDRTLAAGLYTAPFDQLVRGLKYGATLAYAPLFAELVLARLQAVRHVTSLPLDVVLPVPLSRERMASRGFNQSIEIGRVVARRLAVPMDTTSVLRVHDTAPQASLPFDARRRNIRGAFALIDSRQHALDGLHVAVVDDVMTTGATLDELSRVLKRGGAASVVALVVARTP